MWNLATAKRSTYFFRNFLSFWIFQKMTVSSRKTHKIHQSFVFCSCGNYSCCEAIKSDKKNLPRESFLSSARCSDNSSAVSKTRFAFAPATPKQHFLHSRNPGSQAPLPMYLGIHSKETIRGFVGHWHLSVWDRKNDLNFFREDVSSRATFPFLWPRVIREVLSSWWSNLFSVSFLFAISIWYGSHPFTIFDTLKPLELWHCQTAGLCSLLDIVPLSPNHPQTGIFLHFWDCRKSACLCALFLSVFLCHAVCSFSLSPD